MYAVSRWIEQAGSQSKTSEGERGEQFRANNRDRPVSRRLENTAYDVLRCLYILYIYILKDERPLDKESSSASHFYTVGRATGRELANADSDLRKVWMLENRF